ncbi:hypothetical protein F4824DRAFT_313038 [Ustulina deusta]|nr:hypothetical protein F4824DRAFT_313038 [Ustulina deusta]
MARTPTLSRNRRQLTTNVGILILIVGVFHLFHESRRVSVNTSQHVTTATSVDEKGHQGHCPSLGGLEDVFVIVRTGSNEVNQKIPPLLNTTLPCFRHYGIWSDMEEEFAGIHIADALDEIDSGLVAQHSDFEYYRYLRAYGKSAVSDEVAGWADAPNTDLGRDTPAWKLDKWKFLPVASKAYRQHPTSKWYVFIEGDTYVFWTSLLAYLSAIDASKPLYIGREMNIGSSVFAYGGAGIIVSNSAMGMLVKQHTADNKTYNEFTINQWAGDFILSRVITDAGVELSPIWPTLEGEKLAMIDVKTISNEGRFLWCYNVASYHHMNPDDIYTYYDFERRWKLANNTFPRHGDIFRELVFPQMKDQISYWDNLSSDVQSENASFAECRRICESQADCVQFSLASHTCKTSSSAKLGKGQSNEQQWNAPVDSGWILKRVESFMEKMEASCSGSRWVMP